MSRAKATKQFFQFSLTCGDLDSTKYYIAVGGEQSSAIKGVNSFGVETQELSSNSCTGSLSNITQTTRFFFLPSSLSKAQQLCDLIHTYTLFELSSPPPSCSSLHYNSSLVILLRVRSLQPHSPMSLELSSNFQNSPQNTHLYTTVYS